MSAEPSVPAKLELLHPSQTIGWSTPRAAPAMFADYGL
jgi:hypothetical protein